MVVEVTGCSGAGKSTLLREVLRQCREHDVSVATVPEVLLRGIPRPAVQNPTLQNLALDLAGACRSMLARQRYVEFLTFARTTIRREADWLITSMNAYRSVLRTVGIHKALARRRFRGAVLVDEGTINSAHNILAHVGGPPRENDIDTFRRLVPMPDLIVHVTASLEVILARTAARRDPPLLYRSRDDNARFIRHAHMTFDRLMTGDALSRYTVRLECDDDRPERQHFRARQIVERIVETRSRPSSPARPL